MKYEYSTTHDTVERTMTHHFVGGYEVKADFKNKIVATTKNGRLIEKQSMEQIGSLTNYEKHISRVAQAAEVMTDKGLAHA